MTIQRALVCWRVSELETPAQGPNVIRQCVFCKRRVWVMQKNLAAILARSIQIICRECVASKLTPEADAAGEPVVYSMVPLDEEGES